MLGKVLLFRVKASVSGFSKAEEQYLGLLWGSLKEEMFLESYLQRDETGMKVQDGVTEGECHRGYLWRSYAPEKSLWCLSTRRVGPGQ